MDSAGTTATLVAVIIILSKIIEGLWKKYGQKSNTVVATLHPDQHRRLREIHEKFLLLERDINDMKEDSSTIAAAMNKIADCMKNISETDHKIAELVEKLDRRQEIEEEIRKRFVAGITPLER